MNKAIILGLVLLLSTASAFNILQNKGLRTQDSNDDKVKVNLYFESLCPGCHQFIMGALKTAASTKVLLHRYRTSGRSVSSISSHTAMQDDTKMAPAGPSTASMALENARATLLRPAL